jgi:hypothetical protein
MTRASVETVPPIKKIVDREFRHLQRFATALRLALPHRDEVDIYWGLHFALAMIRQTVTDSERLKKLSGGLYDLNDVDDIIRRIVSTAHDALVGGTVFRRHCPREHRIAQILIPLTTSICSNENEVRRRTGAPRIFCYPLKRTRKS